MKVEKKAYRISEFCEAYGICRSKAYLEIGAKRLKYKKIGRLTLITQEAAEQWLSSFGQDEVLPTPKAAI